MSSTRKTITKTLSVTGITLAAAWIFVALSTGPSPADSNRIYSKAGGEKCGLGEHGSWKTSARH